MAGGAKAPAHCVVVGATHRNSTATLRDRLFVEDAAAPAVLRALQAAGLTQAILLSTCDRVEVQAITAEPEAARGAVASVLARRAGLEPAAVAAALEIRSGEQALRHVFAIAASLGSAVMGEPQVLGQVKAAHRLARDAGMVGGELEAVLQAAYAAAKRVRSETSIAAGPVTIAATAIAMARQVHGELEPQAGLLIGAGDMGQFLAERLRQAGLGSLTVATRNAARAEALARELGGHHVDFDALAAALPGADIVICCAGTGRYLITGEMMEQALRRRRRRPVYLIDAATPSDVEPAVNRVDDAYLYDLADLERLALAGQTSRAESAESAWRILDEEVASFLRERAERSAVPVLTALRRRFEALREQVLAHEGGRDPETATRLLLNRLLHDPSEELRGLAAEADGSNMSAAAERLLARLFRLDAPPAANEDGSSGAEPADKEERK